MNKTGPIVVASGARKTCVVSRSSEALALCKYGLYHTIGTVLVRFPLRSHDLYFDQKSRFQEIRFDARELQIYSSNG